MKLPNLQTAVVPSEKIKSYLLDVTHDEGRGKAIFFLHFGFSVAEWDNLAQSLLNHAHDHEVVREETTLFGKRYVIEGKLQTPSGRMPQVRVVWFIAIDDSNPRLVTAYAMEEQDD